MLKPISKKQFKKRLKGRKLEDLSVIKSIEDYLIKKRGYVFHMPKPGESVILLLSGGLDSIVAWGMLMEEYKLNVYPISFDMGEKRAKKEEASINFFSKFYKKRFNSLFHAPKRLNLDIEDLSIHIEDPLKRISPDMIFENFKGINKPIDINTAFESFLLLPIYGKVYADNLYHTKNIPIDTIFCSVLPTDGLLIPFQTFTSLRSIMYNMCVTSYSYKWQFVSLAFEKETGLYLNKNDLVKWGYSKKIPMEKTWTCWHSGKYQCGSDCITCYVRREAFRKAAVPDKTKYVSIANQNLRLILKRMILHFLKSLKLNKIKYDA